MSLAIQPVSVPASKLQLLTVLHTELVAAGWSARAAETVVAIKPSANQARNVEAILRKEPIPTLGPRRVRSVESCRGGYGSVQRVRPASRFH